jgi:hypothetical protein
VGFFGVPPVRLKLRKRGQDEAEYEEFELGVEGMELFRRSFRRQVDTGYEARLRIANRDGKIKVSRHDEPNVIVEVNAELYAASGSDADEQLRRIQDGIVVDGNRIEVVTPDLRRPEFGIFFFGRGPKVDYEIRVPANTDVNASSHNGAVEISGTQRPVNVENRNGKVTIEDVAAEVTVENRNGRIAVERCAGPVRVANTNGAITVARAGSGVEARTRNGSVEVSEAGGGVSAESTNGPLRFNGRVNGDVSLQATNGGIRMAVSSDSRFEIDAESRHGGVHSDLPVRDRPPGGEGGPVFKVHLRTTNGGIRLTEL